MERDNPNDKIVETNQESPQSTSSLENDGSEIRN